MLDCTYNRYMLDCTLPSVQPGPLEKWPVSHACMRVSTSSERAPGVGSYSPSATVETDCLLYGRGHRRNGQSVTFACVHHTPPFWTPRECPYILPIFILLAPGYNHSFSIQQPLSLLSKNGFRNHHHYTQTACVHSQPQQS